MIGDDDDESCIICLDRFTDPVVCADGCAYCRRCAGRWSGGDETWRSVRLNVSCRGPCVLVADVLRNARSVAAGMLAVARAPSVAEQVLLAATLRGAAGAPVADAAAAREVLARALGSRAWTECGPHALLELASRCDRLGDLPRAVVVEVLRVDRLSSTAPLLQRQLLRRLLMCLARAGDSMCLVDTVARHLWLRAAMCDAVVVPPERARGTGAAGVYRRATWSLPGTARFERARSRATLLVPVLMPHYYGQTEAQREVVVTSASGKLVFTSVQTEGLPPPDQVWAARRCTLPFPDSSGDLPLALGPAVPECCTIFEEALTFLPCRLGYLPCDDAPCAIAFADEARRSAAAAALSNVRYRDEIAGRRTSRSLSRSPSRRAGAGAGAGEGGRPGRDSRSPRSRTSPDDLPPPPPPSSQ